jgi:hypothetical protein
MIYYVIINENINSKLLFSLNNNFKSKFNVCHFKSTYLHSFQHGKTQNLLWPVNAIDQLALLSNNQYFRRMLIFLIDAARKDVIQNSNTIGLGPTI